MVDAREPFIVLLEQQKALGLAGRRTDGCYTSRGQEKWPSCHSAIKVALGYAPCGFGTVFTGVSTSLLPLGQCAPSQSPLDTGVSLVRLVVATRTTRSRMRLSRLRETLEMVCAIDAFPSLDDSFETSRSAGLFFRRRIRRSLRTYRANNFDWRCRDGGPRFLLGYRLKSATTLEMRPC